MLGKKPPNAPETRTEDTEDTCDNDWSLFEEPADFRPPPPEARWRVIPRRPQKKPDPEAFRVRLVGHHSLWAHELWNAGQSMMHHLDAHPAMVCGKTVLELGAAAGLPSLVAYVNGAAHVCMTDYPDPQLVENMTVNCEANLPGPAWDKTRLVPAGYIWGADVGPLLDAISPPPQRGGPRRKFDLILLADLIFNHAAHSAMLQTLAWALEPDGKALVTFSHHLPQHKDKDLGFFRKAVDDWGMTATRVYTEKWPVMFEQDSGDAEIRGTVTCIELRLPRNP